MYGGVYDPVFASCCCCCCWEHELCWLGQRHLSFRFSLLQQPVAQPRLDCSSDWFVVKLHNGVSPVGEMEYEKAITCITVEWLIWDVRWVWIYSVVLCLRVLPVSSWLLTDHLPILLTSPLLFPFYWQCHHWEREREREWSSWNKETELLKSHHSRETTRPRMRLLRYNEDKQFLISSNLQASEPPALLVELCNGFFLNVKCRWRYPYCNALCNSKYTHIEPLRFHACLST